MAKTNFNGFNELFRPLSLMAIAGEAVVEVSRAREKHGPNTDLADGIGSGSESILSDAGITFVSNIRAMKALQRLNDRHTPERPTTRLAVMLEEAFEAAAADSVEDLRTELIQTIAMALDWVADIDERA